MEDVIQENLLSKITLAISKNQFSCVEEYIQKGFNIRYKGFKVFENAALDNNLEMYEYLWSFLKFKDEDDRKDTNDYLFIECISLEGNQILEFLSTKIDDLSQSKREHLLTAVNTENKEVINIVLSKNARIIDKNYITLNKIINLDNLEIFNTVLDHLEETNKIKDLNFDIYEYTSLLAKENIKTYLEQMKNNDRLENILTNKKPNIVKKKI